MSRVSDYPITVENVLNFSVCTMPPGRIYCVDDSTRITVDIRDTLKWVVFSHPEHLIIFEDACSVGEMYTLRTS